MKINHIAIQFGLMANYNMILCYPFFCIHFQYFFKLTKASVGITFGLAVYAIKYSTIEVILFIILTP